MTTSILNFYWNENKNNCIAILNYEFDGMANVTDDSYQNDASPSCLIKIIEGKGESFKLFFPSHYEGEGENLDEFALFDNNEEFICFFPSIKDVIKYFYYNVFI